MNLVLVELIMQFQEEVDWMRVLETALKESEKMVLPLAIFKVRTMLQIFFDYLGYCTSELSFFLFDWKVTVNALL